MTELFTGKAISKSVSMPEDMWAYFERRRTSIGIPVSRQIQDLVEDAITRDAQPARVLVDTRSDYRPDRPGSFITAQVPDGGR